MISEICSLGLSDDELSRWHDDDLSPARVALIRAHLGSCSACRERLASFEAIGVGLRSLQPPPLDVERLLANLHQTAPLSAPSPLMPITPQMPERSPRRIATGAAGLAAVLILSLLAGYLFVTHGPPLIGDNSQRGNPLLITISEMPLGAALIDMASPSEGWAFGAKSGDGDSPVIALQYSAGKWTRVQTAVEGRINALKMFSAIDGWLVGSNVYHYDGHSWRKVTVPDQASYTEYTKIAAFSASSIWISGHSDKPIMLHYDGTMWSRQVLPTPEALHLGYYDVSSVAMASDNEGWAVGSSIYSPNPAKNTLVFISVLLHYANGAWRIERTCENCMLQSVSMASVSDGWIGGDYEAQTGSGSLIARPLLWRLSNGVWRDAPLPSTVGVQPPLLGQIVTIQMLSPTEGWMTAGIHSSSEGNQPSNQPLNYMPLYHLQNGQWTQMDIRAFPSPFNGDVFAFVSPTEFWAIGSTGISHYRNGDWKNVVA